MSPSSPQIPVPRTDSTLSCLVMMLCAIGLIGCVGCEKPPEQVDFDLPADALSRQLSLASAIEHDNTDEARLLINGGLDPNAPIEGGLPPLHLAAFQGRVAMGELLISLGADVNGAAVPADESGPRPLHVAVSRSKLLFLQLLLQKNAGPNILDGLQQTPLDLVVGKTTLLAHRVKQSRGASEEQRQRLKLAAMQDIEKLLREHGAKTTAELERGRLDARLQTQTSESLIEKSSRRLEKSKAKTADPKRPSNDRIRKPSLPPDLNQPK
ncbi:MAG: ankyrin repeat domain-containing protein [Pirellulales bacterium]|nr:ankyrin repeat domain-containing protein [Pirellulales bacterium]